MGRPLDVANHIVSTTFPVNFSDAHVKWVKHNGLVSFGHSVDLFCLSEYIDEGYLQDKASSTMSYNCKLQPGRGGLISNLQKLAELSAYHRGYNI